MEVLNYRARSIFPIMKDFEISKTALAPYDRRQFLRCLTGAALTLPLVDELPAASGKPRIILDPGHGGKDGGSYWYGIKEKDLTLDLAKRVSANLKKAGVPTLLTRSTDVYVELENRAKIANDYEGSIFVSLHFNAHKDRSIRGIESFYYPGSQSGQRLASVMQSELGRRIKTRNRGTKANRLKVLQSTKGPAALVECGFISNRWECDRCSASWFRQVLSEEITEGIARFL